MSLLKMDLNAPYFQKLQPKERYLYLIEELKKIKSPAKVVVVAKSLSDETLLHLYNAGCRDFGENRLEKAHSHQKLLQDPHIRWHFIGTIQSKKIPTILKNFSFIHSVASKKHLLSILNSPFYDDNKHSLFLEVHTSHEPSKQGFLQEDLILTIKELSTNKKLSLFGLMTMAPFTENLEDIKNSFLLLKNLKYGIEKRFSLDNLELSMGMSHDFPIALEWGATYLRLGSIFSS